MKYAECIYQIVRKVPSDKVTTYGQIAKLLGDAHLSRVVGNLLHVNPDPEYTPCFRVVNGQGGLAKHFGDGGLEGHTRRMTGTGIEVNQGKVDLKCYGWDGRIPYLSLNRYLQQTYGRKMYKVALDGGFDCPNRDGLLDTRGCIFCSVGGSGDFAQNRKLSITEQIDLGKRLIENKLPKASCEAPNLIAYFQAFTGTYAPVEELRKKYMEAIMHREVAILAIATRPDCISEEVLNLLEEMAQIKPVWVELGLQTIHPKTEKYIRRGYPLEVYDKAIMELKKRDIPTVTHVILGLPGETKKQMLETVEYVGNSGCWGIKLQLLHVLKGTDLEQEYRNGTFSVLEMEEYADLVQSCVAILPPEMVIHRLTGDGDKKTLIAPLWSGDKKRVLNELKKRLVEQDI